MTTQIKKVYELFYDKNNSLLEGGYIYIGSANQNPITNPISTYFDADLTIPALQPLRTVNGAISNNGTTANVYISETDYSIVVQDKNKVTLYSTLERTSETAIGELNYTNTLYTGGIKRSAQILISRILDFKDFGAKGNGVTNDTPAINALLTQIGSNGANLKFSSTTNDGRYLIGSAINWGLAQNLNIEFDKNAVLIPANNNFDMMTIQGARPNGTYQTFSADASSSDYSITLSSVVVGANVGDYLGIQSDALLDGTNSKATKQYIFRRIVAISGTTYDLNDILGYNFLVSDNAQAGLAVIKKNYNFYGVNVNDWNSGNVLFSRGLVLKQCANVNVQGGNMYGSKLAYEPSTSYFGKTAIFCEDVLDSVFRDVKLEKIGYYGASVLHASENILFDNFIGKDMRHLFDITWASNSNGYEGEPTNIKFQNSVVNLTTESCYSTHDTGRYIIFDKCVGDRAGSGGIGAYIFYSRNVGTRYNNCNGYRASLDIFRADSSAIATKYTNCEAVEGGRDGFRIDNYGTIDGSSISTRNQEAGVAFGGGTISNMRIIDNGLSGSRKYAIACLYYANATSINIRDIDAPASSNQTVAIRLETGSGLEPRDKVFISGKCIFTGYNNNLYSVSSGDNVKVPISSGEIITDLPTASNPISGLYTLSGGTVTVTTNKVRNYNPTSGTAGQFTHTIKATPINNFTTGSVSTTNIVDGVSFTRTSTNASSTVQERWSIGV